MPSSDDESSEEYEYEDGDNRDDDDDDEDDDDDDEYNVEDEPTTWKEYEQHQQYVKQKEAALKQQNLLQGNENSSKSGGAVVNAIEDPMGITLDGRSFANRMTQWDALKQQQKNMESMNKDVYISKDNFSASLFLASVHRHTPTEDLLNKGRDNLMKNQKRLESKMRKLIQQNLAKFIEAKDSLDKIHKTKDSKFKDNSLQSIQNQFKSLNDQSSELFNPLIRVKKRGEDIKEALTALKKYGFVFNLPTNIAENIEKRDYKKVVMDYNKSKYYRRKCTDGVTVFKPIFDSVDEQVDRLRNLLFGQLVLKDDDLYSNKLLTDEQEKTIGYLNALDSDVDPAWYYVNELRLFALRLFDTCEEANRKELHILKQQKAQLLVLEKRWKQISDIGDQNPHQKEEDFLIVIPEDINESELISRSDLEVEGIKLVKGLCTVLKTVLPSLWTLCKNFLSGKYQNKSQKYDLKTKNNILKMQNIQYEADIVIIFTEIIDTFATKISEALDAIDGQTAHETALCHGISEVIDTYEYLIPLIPARYMNELQEFADLKRRWAITELWSRTHSEIACFYSIEDWSTISESQTITKLPMKFQEYVFNTINMLKPFIRVRDNLFNEVHDYLVGAILAFADTLHALIFNNTKSVHGQPKRVQSYVTRMNQRKKENELLLLLSNTYYTKTVIIPDLIFAFIAAFKYASNIRKEDVNSTPSQEKETTEVEEAAKSESDEDSDDDSKSDASDTSSSNHYSDEEDEEADEKEVESTNSLSEKEIAKLVAQFQTREDFQYVLSTYDSLVKFALDSFVRRKAAIFNTLIEKGFLLSGYNWAKSPEPEMVRPYVLDILLDLAVTHSNIERITSILNETTDSLGNQPAESTSSAKQSTASQNSFVKRIFTKLFERLAELFFEYVRNLQMISAHGALQIDIDVSFIRKALGNFETRRSKSICLSIMKYLQDCWSHNKTHKLKEQVLNKTTKETQVQLDCFSANKPASSMIAANSLTNRQRSIGLLRMTHM